DLRAADTGMTLTGWATGKTTVHTPAGKADSPTLFVSANYFKTFGVELARGAGFDDAQRKRDSAQPQDAQRKRDSAQPQDAQRKRDSAQPQDAQRKRDSAQPQDAQRKRDSAQPQESIDDPLKVRPVVILAYTFWKNRLGSDPEV